jgi:hypothetical protein
MEELLELRLEEEQDTMVALLRRRCDALRREAG